MFPDVDGELLGVPLAYKMELLVAAASVVDVALPRASSSTGVDRLDAAPLNVTSAFWLTQLMFAAENRPSNSSPWSGTLKLF